MASSSRRSRARPADLIRAVVELALARFRLRRQRSVATFPDYESTPLDDRQTALIERVTFVIPRAAARLPWRADCLVQAMAAEHWLGRAGIETRLTLGVPKDKQPNFEAHAWLSAGNRIITGGDVSCYIPLGRP